MEDSPPPHDHLGGFILPGGGGADPSIMSVVEELWALSCPPYWSKHVLGGAFSTHANPRDTSVLPACSSRSERREQPGVNWCNGTGPVGGGWVEEWVEEWVRAPDQSFIHGSSLLD